jgi:hypothetical protein
VLIAHVDPAGGAPTQDLIPAAFVAFVALLGLLLLARSHRTGRSHLLERTTGWTTTLPGVGGMPPWASAPVVLTSVSLITAVFGFYWDVSTHIDNGRDPGPFANPAHYFILAGLAGIALAGFVACVLGLGERDPGGVRFRPHWRVPVGGLLLLACGVIALAGFPLDDVWHRIFGQDVTLWGPTHIQMVAGASLATLAMWVLYLEGGRAAPGTARRWPELAMAGAFLIGLATLQGEFDFGVPQFRLVFQPILLALAAGVGLVTARIRCGRWGALIAALGFIVLRGGLAIVVGPVLGRSVPHFPLFLVEALLVEAVATTVDWRTRPLRFGAVCGLLVGTVGLAAEWAWSHVWMPLPWKSGLLPEALVWVPLAGIAAGVIGALVGRSLAADVDRVAFDRVAVPRFAGLLAGAVVVAALWWPLPTNGGDGIRAAVSLRDLNAAKATRTVEATIRLQPPDAADHNDFFTVTAWQGAQWKRMHVVIDPLVKVGDGVWRTTEPIPVHGDWKATIRLHDGRTLAALPIYMPFDPGIPAPEVPATTTFTRTFVADKAVLQREFTGGPGWLQGVAYAGLGAIAAGWIWIIAWGLGRFAGDGRSAAGTVVAGRATAPVTETVG